ncbi:MAG TPA: YncE family protein, partial [Candidatus Wunengus sp. YC63]
MWVLLTVITSLAAVNSLPSKACNFSMDNVAQGGNQESQGKKCNQESVDSRFEALKRWYESTHHSSSTFMVGFYPYGVAFDGANIWVTNSGSESITKLRASDGTVRGTYAVG